MITGAQYIPPFQSCRFPEFLSLLEQADIDVLQYLNNTNPQAKDEFLASSSLPKPRNQYGNLDIDRVCRNLDELEAAQAGLAALRLSPAERTVSEALLSFCLRKNRFVRANHRYQALRGTAARAQAAEEHRRANIALYGPAEEAVFRSILAQRLDTARRRVFSAEERGLYRELTELLGPIEAPQCAFFAPSRETFTAFSRLIRSFYQPFFTHIPAGQQTFTAEDVCRITNEILDTELASLGKGWRAVVGPDKVSAETDTQRKQIVYPLRRSRGPYTPEDVKTVIVHELGVHALRSMPFSGSPFPALTIGLPGYETFEEGLATAVEQAVRGQFQHRGLLHYVSIGLAAFLGKSFRGVFEIQIRLEGLAGGASPSVCFDSVQRAFRGTGELPNHKDLVYFNGNQRIWRFIQDHIHDPDGLLDILFHSGKSDPQDPLFPLLFPTGKAGRNLAGQDP